MVREGESLALCPIIIDIPTCSLLLPFLPTFVLETLRLSLEQRT